MQISGGEKTREGTSGRDGINSKRLEGGKRVDMSEKQQGHYCQREKVVRDEDREIKHTMYILEEPHKDFGFYSECEEKILSFKKITWAARETRAGEQE